jgi:hypothetical protein
MNNTKLSYGVLIIGITLSLNIFVDYVQGVRITKLEKANANTAQHQHARHGDEGRDGGEAEASAAR